MSTNRSLTITQPIPDPRPRWRRLLDWLRRRPAPEPGNLLIYFPNVEITDTFFMAPDQLAVEFTVRPPESIGAEWVDLGFMSDDGVRVSTDGCTELTCTYHGDTNSRKREAQKATQTPGVTSATGSTDQEGNTK